MENRLAVDSFEDFVAVAEPRLHDALSALLGGDLGREATAEALAYGWQNWDRVEGMDNPAGYLYAVGRDRSRRFNRRQRRLFESESGSRIPWVEPGLPTALAGLSERQRVVVTLVYCFEWSLSEVAELLGLRKTTVQNHSERGLAKLRSSLGVEV